ncbi:hypothetical protein JXA34_03695 [Patescibacteria group bacterium]|nr:hypothetical protein [Patescibacteria group bacterium]
MEAKFWTWMKAFVVIILAGALSGTGWWVLVGRGLKGITTAPGQVAQGYTGEENPSIQIPGGPHCLFGGKLCVNMGGTTFYLPTGEESWLDEGGSGGSESQIVTFEVPEESEDTTGAQTAPETNTGGAAEYIRSGKCAMYVGFLKGLGDGADYTLVEEQANEVLAECPGNDVEAMEVAAAAMGAVGLYKARLQAEADTRQMAIDSWNTVAMAAESLSPTDTRGFKSIVTELGGTFHLAEIEGLLPKILQRIVGGGEPCHVYVNPPTLMAGDVKAVEMTVQLAVLWDLGIGAEGHGLTLPTVPEFPADYTLTEE